MADLTEEQLHDGVTVDIAFDSPGPEFGDLFMICGYDNPNFPPPGDYAFGEHSDLGFCQKDDYFGIESESEEGDDVIVWLSPVVDGDCVEHHPGPFDAIRLQFSVLRNLPENAERFLQCVTSLATLSPEPAPNIDAIQSEIDAITEHWQSTGIMPGSSEALQVER